MRSVARPRDAWGPARARSAPACCFPPGAGVHQRGEQHRRQGLGAPAARPQGLGVLDETVGDGWVVGVEAGLGAQAQALGDVQPAVATLPVEAANGIRRAHDGFVGLALGEVDLRRHQQQLGDFEVIASSRRQRHRPVDQLLGVVEQVGVGEGQRVVGVQPRQLALRPRLPVAVLGRGEGVECFGEVALARLQVREVLERRGTGRELADLRGECDRLMQPIPRVVVLARADSGWRPG